MTVCPRCRPRGLQWVAVGLPCSSGSSGSHRRSGGRRWHPDEWPCALGALAETPHISATTSRPLCDDSPGPYPLPDRATCAGMPLSNNPGGDLRSFGHQRAVSVTAIRRVQRVPNRIRSPSRDGIVGLCSPAQSAQSQQQRVHGLERMSRGRASSDPSAPGASHANRQVRTMKLPPTELCIEPMPGRQLRRGRLRRSLTHARANL